MANLTQNSWQSGSTPTNPIFSFNYFPSDGVNSMDVNNLSTKTASNLAGLDRDYSISIAGKPSLGLDKSSTINQATGGAEVGESIYASFSNGHHSMFETAANQVKHEIAVNGSYDIPTVLVRYEGMTADAYGHAEAT
jgi:hypothetical protein